MPRDLATALYHRGRFWLIFEPRDIWLGVFISPRAVFVCVVPCLAVKWEKRPKPVRRAAAINHAEGD